MLLQVRDKEKFALILTTYNNAQPVKIYPWKVLPLGILNSSTLCQYFVKQLLEIICKQFPQSKIYHYIDDMSLSHSDEDTLGIMFDKVNRVYCFWGLQIVPERVG